ncbi:MAG TPA: hypothetical protein VFP72_09280, partial [Kineosporiaceae bacterium]|nr:hypothetical protein [Kineosporiaceae bacterium]
ITGLSASKIGRLRSGAQPNVPSEIAEIIAQTVDAHPEEFFRGTPASDSTRRAFFERQTVGSPQTAGSPQAAGGPQVSAIDYPLLESTREAARVSRDDLARAAGWEYAGEVAQFLDGHRTTLDAVAADRISQYLGAPVDIFFTTPESSSAAGPSGSGAGRSGAAPGVTVTEGGVQRPTWWPQQPADQVVVVPVSDTDYPTVAQHIRDAVASGHPRVLTLDRNASRMRTRRKQSTRDFPNLNSYYRDVYPPVMTQESGLQESGRRPSVRNIPRGQNRAPDAMRSYLRPYPDRTKFRLDPSGGGGR